MIVIVIFVAIAAFAIFCSVSSAVSSAQEISNTAAKRRLEDFAVMDGGILRLKKRGPELEKALKIKSDVYVDIHHQDEQYIYTSATVGGVTTGGVSKIDGYDYASGFSKTGKYCLEFAGRQIWSIKLDYNLFDAAKNSTMAPYLNENNREITVINPVNMPTEVSYMWESGHSTAAINSINKASRAGYPDYNKCAAIKAWLCRKE